MRNLLIVAVLIVLLLSGCKAQEITGGNIHIRNREYDKAIEQFKLATLKYPNKADPYVSLSAAYFKKKEYKNAADALDKALHANKKEAEISIKWYENFLHIEEYAWSVLYNGAVIFRDEDPKRALEIVKISEDVETPRNKSYSYNLHANILTMMDKFDEALVYYKKAIDADETNIDPYITLGRYYVIKMQPENAIPYLEKSLEIDTTVTEVYTVLGQAYLDLEEFDKAIAVLKKSANILKDNPGILYNLAISYFKGGEHQSAIETALKVIGMKGINTEFPAKSYDLIGQIYITDEKYNEAINILEEAIQKNPNNCEAYHLMAIAYLKIDNKQLSSKYADEWDECLEIE